MRNLPYKRWHIHTTDLPNKGKHIRINIIYRKVITQHYILNQLKILHKLQKRLFSKEKMQEGLTHNKDKIITIFEKYFLLSFRKFNS